MEAAYVAKDILTQRTIAVNVNEITYCPICKVALVPKQLSAHIRQFNGLPVRLYALNFCNSCNNCFLAIYEQHGNGNFPLIQATPLAFSGSELPEEVKNKFPDFVLIYHQAEEAEVMGLSQICGMGYRKALEFLVKEFCKMENPNDVDDIEQRRLKPCIDKYIKDEMIKDLATIATFLGNDETHFIRKYIDKDVSDMKEFILSMVQSVENTLRAKKAKALILNPAGGGTDNA